MKLTPKQIEESKRLSDINEKSKYFFYEGETWKLIGTRHNKNGSWTHTRKNRAGEIKEIGDKTLNDILNR